VYVQVVQALGWSLGTYCYGRYLVHVSVHSALKILLPLSAMLQLAAAPLFGGITDANQAGSYSYIIVWILCMQATLAAWNVPVYTYMEKLCPGAAKSTILALLLCSSNIGLMASTQVCVLLQYAFQIKTTDFTNLAYVVCLCTLCQLAAFGISWFVPKDLESTRDDLDKFMQTVHDAH